MRHRRSSLRVKDESTITLQVGHGKREATHAGGSASIEKERRPPAHPWCVSNQIVSNAGGSFMRRIIPFALVLLSCTILAACGGSMNTMNQSSGVPMSLTIGDTPPSGAAGLFFLGFFNRGRPQPSGSSKTAGFVVSLPPEIQVL